MALDPELLGILACPTCRGSLEPLGAEQDANRAETAQGLACAHCRVVYPIREEIPVMLAEEAIPRREWDAGKREADT